IDKRFQRQVLNFLLDRAVTLFFISSTSFKKLLTDSGILISLATDLVIACDIRELIGRYQKPTF
ncbi:TPA: hypothetical protein ACH5I5_005647, partial [Klebsiella variicola]